QLEEWNSILDVILIFAGLFSGILTAFIIEFYRLMKVDQNELTSRILIDTLAVLRATAANQPIPPPITFDASDSDFTPSHGVVWVNALWFTSLVLSLGAAVAAMVVKQWLQFYVSNLNTGIAHTDALHRQYRHNALKRWKVPTLVSVLPLMMHASVGLFLAGVTVVLWDINHIIATVVLVQVLALFAIYLITLFLPIISVSCPYKSSALILLQ
ncbi:hypothetical protein C8J56DRAFT_714737, partial [Mycena floridula]